MSPAKAPNISDNGVPPDGGFAVCDSTAAYEDINGDPFARGDPWDIGMPGPPIPGASYLLGIVGIS